MRRLCALLLAAAAWQCEPAEPLPQSDASPPVDRGLDADHVVPDAAPPPCPDADEDGVPAAACAPPGQPADCDDTDPRVRPGASDPCGDDIDQDCDGLDTTCPIGCEPNADITPCDAVDDDCDGVVDECGPDRTCDAGRCLADVGAPCATDPDCAPGLRCAEARCARIAAGGLCTDDDDCPRDALCTREIACDPDLDRCYGQQGGRCADSCDCGGAWLCADEAQRCVTCIVDAQCDGPARCTGAGLCATPITLGGDDDALDALLLEILDCARANRPLDIARGCRILDTARLTVAGVEVGALVPPEDARICPPGALTERGFTPDDAADLADLFGCDDAPRRVEWHAPLPAQRSAAACLTHLPRWARPTLAEPSIAIAPCNALVYARE